MEKVIDYLIAGDMNSFACLVVVFVSAWVFKEYYKTSVSRNLQEEQRNNDAIDSYLLALSTLSNEPENVDIAKLYQVVQYYPQWIWEEYLDELKKKNYSALDELIKKQIISLKSNQIDKVSGPFSMTTSFDRFVKRHQLPEWYASIMAVALFWMTIVCLAGITHMVSGYGQIAGYMLWASILAAFFSVGISASIIDMIFETSRKQISKALSRQITISVLIVIATVALNILFFVLITRKSISVGFYLILLILISIGEILWLRYFGAKVKKT